MKLIGNQLGVNDFISIADNAGREIKKIASHKGLNIHIYPHDLIVFQGSLHKYWHGGQNYSDFTFSHICTAIDELCADFRFQPDSAILRKLEFGVNISGMPLDIAKLHGAFLFYKSQKFNDMAIRDPQGKLLGVSCVLKQFVIKGYNKSVQYGLKKDTFRFELKTTRMQFIKSILKDIGIDRPLCLNDLKNQLLIQLLGAKLLSVFDQIILNDYRVKKEDVPKDRRLFWAMAQNPSYWASLREGTKENFSYHKHQFYDLLEAAAGNNIHTTIRDHIDEKIRWLLRT